MRNYALLQMLLTCGISLVVAVLGFVTMRQGRENDRLKKKLRLVLCDCIALYRTEEALCDFVATKKLPETGRGGVIVLAEKTPRAVKCLFRALLRDQGFVTPSDQATPHQLMQEIEKL